MAVAVILTIMHLATRSGKSAIALTNTRLADASKAALRARFITRARLLRTRFPNPATRAQAHSLTAVAIRHDSAKDGRLRITNTQGMWSSPIRYDALSIASTNQIVT